MPGESDSGPTTIPPTAIRTTSATIVSRITSTVATIVFFRMTSSSHRRYRMTAMPAATGIPMPNMMKNAKNRTSFRVLDSPSSSPIVVASVARNRHEGGQADEGDPPDLLALLTARVPVSEHERDHRQHAQRDRAPCRRWPEHRFEDRRDRLDARGVRRIDALGDVDRPRRGASTRRSRPRTGRRASSAAIAIAATGRCPSGTERGTRRRARPPTRKIQLLSQTATWPNGSAPGDV